MPPSTPPNLPYDIHSFVERTKRFCTLERDNELSYDQSQKQKLTTVQLQQLGVIVTKLSVSDVSTGLYGRTLLTLAYKKGHGTRLQSHSLTVRDVVQVIQGNAVHSNSVIGQGTVYKVKEESITVAIDSQKNRVNNDNDDTSTDLDYHSLSTTLTLVKVPNVATYQRYNDVLSTLQSTVNSDSKQLAADRVLRVLYHDQPPTKTVVPFKWTPVSTTLNEAQIDAITQCLSTQDVHLVHGPPGTGKTTTIVELIHQAVLRGDRVLATAPSNIAVDNLVERLAKRKDINLTRIGHPARLLPEVLQHSLDSVIERSDLHKSCLLIRKDITTQQRLLSKSSDKSERYAIRGEMRALQKELRERERKQVAEVMKHCQVTCCTLTGAASSTLQSHDFDLVVIDEAAQSTEVACLIPLLRGKRLVLAGDHCQLGPTIKSDDAARSGFSVTLFDRMIQQHGDSIATLLNVQYRMHQTINDWSSKEFYHKRLLADSSVASHRLTDLPHIRQTPITQATMLLIDTAGCDMNEDERDTDDLKSLLSDSKSNQREAQVVFNHVQHLVDNGVPVRDIAVITPYNAQVQHLRELLLDKYPALEVGTVDGMQGREKEALVYSMVRSNPKHEVGFLREARRTNVAITRAKRHVAIVADSDTVKSDAFLERLIEYVEQHGEVYSAAEYDDDSFMLDAGDVTTSDHTATEAGANTTNGSSIVDSLLQASAKATRQFRVKAPGKPTNKPKAVDNQSTNGASSSQHAAMAARHAPKSAADAAPRPELTEANILSICEQLKAKHQAGDTDATYHFADTLNSYERQQVHAVAEQVGGLSHQSVGTGRSRHVVLALLLSDNADAESAASAASSAIVEPVAAVKVKLTKKEKEKLAFEEKQRARAAAIDRMAEKAGANQSSIAEDSAAAAAAASTTFDVLATDDDHAKADDNETESKDVAAGDERKESPAGVGESAPAAQPAVKPAADADNDDIDAIMRDLRVDKCKVAGCKNKTHFIGHVCKFCKELYCTTHMSAIIHGCEQAYRQDARQRDMDAYRKAQAKAVAASKKVGGGTSSSAQTAAALKTKMEAAKAKVQRKPAAALAKKK